MEAFNNLFTFFFLACGVYCLYIWGRILVTKTLFQNSLLVPTDRTVQDCLDEKAYLRAMGPWFLFLGLVLLFSGFYPMADQKFGLSASMLPGKAHWAAALMGSLLPFAGVVLFAVFLSRAQKKYWK